MTFGSWQDTAFLVAHFVFIIGLLFSIFSKKHKPDVKTCKVYAPTLLGVGIILATAGSYLAALAEFIVAIEWFILLFQKRVGK